MLVGARRLLVSTGFSLKTSFPSRTTTDRRSHRHHVLVANLVGLQSCRCHVVNTVNKPSELEPSQQLPDVSASREARELLPGWVTGSPAGQGAQAPG